MTEQITPPLGEEEAKDVLVDLNKPVEAKPEAKPETVKAAEPAVAKTEAPDPIAELQRQLDESKAHIARETQGRQRAEQAAAESQDRARRFETFARSGQLEAVDRSIDAVASAKDLARRQYIEANTSGNFEEAAAASDKLSELNAELALLRREKARHAAPEVRTEGRVERPAAPSAPADPVEAFASRVSPRSAQWVRANPDVVKNPDRVIAAHNAAVQLQNLTPDTDDYFNYVETALGIRRAETKAAPALEPKTEPRTRSYSAPVTRNTPGAPSTPEQVRMTPEMQRAARIAGITDREYAENWLKAEREGMFMNRH